MDPPTAKGRSGLTRGRGGYPEPSPKRSRFWVFGVKCCHVQEKICRFAQMCTPTKSLRYAELLPGGVQQRPQKHDPSGFSFCFKNAPVGSGGYGAVGGWRGGPLRPPRRPPRRGSARPPTPATGRPACGCGRADSCPPCIDPPLSAVDPNRASFVAVGAGHV